MKETPTNREFHGTCRTISLDHEMNAGKTCVGGMRQSSFGTRKKAEAWFGTTPLLYYERPENRPA
jgi:hypothetical protein